MNNWFEISIILKAENKKIHISDTESLEEAEDKKREFIEAGVNVVVDEWVIKNEIPILVGQI
jgi:predicted peroxiredoxin